MNDKNISKYPMTKPGLILRNQRNLRGMTLNEASERSGLSTSTLSKIENDKINICFICGVKRESLEKIGVKFDVHIHGDHNMWTYAEYIIGLRFIDKQETNSINSYVIEEVEKKQIGWIASNEDAEKEVQKMEEEE